MNSAATPDRVSVILVNWNAGDLLRQAIASVLTSVDQTEVPVQIIVVDNASEDLSLAAVEAISDILVIKNSTNRGFAAACNQGAARAVGKYLLFLNPDCRVYSGAIERCANTLEADETIGVVGVALTADDGSVWRSCHRLPTLWNFFVRLSGLSTLCSSLADGSMRDWPHNSDRQVDHVIGAFYMVRAHQFRLLGGFDERYFVYLEDLDLSKRYHDRGMSCYFLAQPAAYHKGGGLSENIKATRLFYATRSRILYSFKHFGPIRAWLHLVLTVTLEPLARLIGAVVTGQANTGLDSVRAFAMLCRDLPSTLRLSRVR